MQKRLLSLAILTCCLLFNQQTFALLQDEGPSAAERELYLAIIAENFTNHGIRPVLLFNKTLDLKNAPQMLEHFTTLKQKGYDVNPTMISNFEKLNESSIQVEQSFFPSDDVAVIQEGSVKDYLRKRMDAGREMPRAIVTVAFSKVAFMPDKEHALVYVSWVCGGECALHGFLLMEKEHGAWKGQAVGPLTVS